MFRQLAVCTFVATLVAGNVLPAHADFSIFDDIRSTINDAKNTIDDVNSLRNEADSLIPKSKSSSDPSFKKAKKDYEQFYSRINIQQKSAVDILLPTLSENPDANPMELYQAYDISISQAQWMQVFYSLRQVLGQVRDNPNNMDGFLAYAYCINAGMDSCR